MKTFFKINRSNIYYEKWKNVFDIEWKKKNNIEWKSSKLK